jgi:glycosyltransferase involved in cell wall biosynthesis
MAAASAGSFTTANQIPDLSVVIPIYNEEENLGPAVEELLGVLDGMPQTAEVILVDDGSSDSSAAQAFEWALRDDRIRVIQFRRNFGQTAAIQAGFEASRGRAVALMDGDQQNDPADLPMMLQVMDEGYDVVSGWRKDRQDRAISRKLPSKIANRLISKITGTRLHDYGCTLKIYDADVVRHLRLYKDMHRFIPALASRYGANIKEVPVNHRARVRGHSKYGIGRAPRVVLDLLTVKFILQYLASPMRLFGGFGFLSFGFGILTLLGLVTEKVLFHQSLVDRPLLIIASVATMLGAQFLCIGLIGELLTRVYHESGGASPYVVRRTSDDPRTVAPDARLVGAAGHTTEPTRLAARQAQVVPSADVG